MDNSCSKIAHYSNSEVSRRMERSRSSKHSRHRTGSSSSDRIHRSPSPIERRRSRNLSDSRYYHKERRGLTERNDRMSQVETYSEKKRSRDLLIEEKAKEKLSVLSRLGIEIKLPQNDNKKKKLWGDKVVGSGNVWNNASFGDDQATEKFKRLMGMRSSSIELGASSGSVSKQQENLFKKMEEEYEIARQTTHTMRGIGLGFPK